MDRRVTIDPGTQAIVHQTLDARTHEVVDQLPDQAMLGLRAYFERLAENSAGAAGEGDDHARVLRIQA